MSASDMTKYRLNNMSFKAVLRAIWPAIAVLAATLIISVFIAEFTYVAGEKALWVVLLRFIRFALVLTLPLLVLRYVCGWIKSLFGRRGGRLALVEEVKDFSLDKQNIWLIRPLQGIALVMLIASKMIGALQLYAYQIPNATVIPPSQFDPWRFVIVNIIFAATSLLLSALWALDDLGIRYLNTKDKELKMLGKYFGLLLPVFFGFYGIFNLLEDYEYIEAVQYIVQMIVIYYPPFVIFGVLHSYYIRKNEAALIKQLGAEPYVVSIDEKDMKVTRDRI
jgi:hypothetical protein